MMIALARPESTFALVATKLPSYLPIADDAVTHSTGFTDEENYVRVGVTA